MKHLILFLNFSKSRLVHPVFLQFSKNPVDRVNTALLFLSRPLEERDLLHEVNELRRKEAKEKLSDMKSDVTFHLCANFEHPGEAHDLTRTVRLIRKLFPKGKVHKHRCLAYLQIPELSNCSDKTIKNIWNNLVETNNAVTEYQEFNLLNRAFLYRNDQQQMLAEFLYTTIQSNIDTGKNLALNRDKGIYPPLFAAFSTTGVSYPEQQIHRYLRSLYLHNILKCSLPSHNATPLQTCNEEAQLIMSHLPLQNQRICLQEEAFLALPNEDQNLWTPVSQYWQEIITQQAEKLKDTPHREWLGKIRQRTKEQWRTRFRSKGAEAFFSFQEAQTGTYANILLAIIREQFLSIVHSHAYSPEALKTILRAVINLLQQKVLEIGNIETELQASLQQTEKEIALTIVEWNNLSFLSRMLNKDSEVLDRYNQQLSLLYSRQTHLLGCHFAVKLLNELIPLVQEMQEDINAIRLMIDQTLSLTEQALNEANPSAALGKQSLGQLETAVATVNDTASLYLPHYQKLQQYLFGAKPVLDPEHLYSILQHNFGNEAENYLKQSTADGTLPPVLYLPITERIQRQYTDRGGFPAFIELLKERTPIHIALKDKKNASHFMLISSSPTDDEKIEHIMTDDSSHIQLLHLQYDVHLTDLEGFSGQRMLIEPTLF